jgi:hypothetical protein
VAQALLPLLCTCRLLDNPSYYLTRARTRTHTHTHTHPTQVNLVGPMRVTQAFLPLLRTGHTAGRIVNISSQVRLARVWERGMQFSIIRSSALGGSPPIALQWKHASHMYEGLQKWARGGLLRTMGGSRLGCSQMCPPGQPLGFIVVCWFGCTAWLQAGSGFGV